MDDVASAVGAAIKDAGVSRDEILCVGVGTPGSVNKKTGYIEFANNLDFNNVPAKEILERKIGKTVYLDNDANCAALGEAIAGVGKGVRSLVAVTLGTGFGSGVIINGKIVGGVNYAAGEIGHTVVKFDGKPCNCGRRGCLEQYASATALIEQTKEAMLKNRGCKMWSLVNGDIDAVNGKTAFDGARMNDPVAAAVVDEYVRYLSVGIINIINALQPEIICVGGGVGREGENILEPLRKLVEKERYSVHAARQTKLAAAELGVDAGIFGAALLDD